MFLICFSFDWTGIDWNRIKSTHQGPRTYINEPMHKPMHEGRTITMAGERDNFLLVPYCVIHTCMHTYIHSILLPSVVPLCMFGVIRNSWSRSFSRCVIRIHTYIHAYIYAYIHSIHLPSVVPLYMFGVIRNSRSRSWIWSCSRSCSRNCSCSRSSAVTTVAHFSRHRNMRMLRLLLNFLLLNL